MTEDVDSIELWLSAVPAPRALGPDPDCDYCAGAGNYEVDVRLPGTSHGETVLCDCSCFEDQ